ncbi:DUF1636 domain-containing protein [Acidiphilium sp. PA]|uniref:DUF1636 domain-containing protein n=1 Tax=Acidiphilium sp. PA TaxID=2871705 RepID=UPI0022435917|nr:DUF1636 domain-containing protein [Acidiphilium sp. PA]MCW8307499.1 DUF1636 domain-containing protein [Acidiphilium sp. PA]
MTDAVAHLHVCITCRAGLPLEPGGVPMGADLYAALAACAEGAPVVLRGVECLAMCAHGCSAAISMPGKWSYLLGGLRPAMAGDLMDYARSYVASGSGTIMPSRRAASLRDMIVGRVPAFDAGMGEAAE